LSAALARMAAMLPLSEIHARGGTPR
jgi:hypothetical protein